MTRSRQGQFTEFGIMADEIRVRSTVQRNESGRRVVQKQQQDFSSSITFLSLPGTSLQGSGDEETRLQPDREDQCSAKRRLRIPPLTCTPLALEGILNELPVTM
ncbi:hypothetical protein ARMGADRAFT_1011925 [Armillaria gallica]|uniref:Uncharacterized protein n=1 Tax=Armillaria gallica TaxID=47427 RepID=A0A2H3DZA5_ARMGA|nr:hypothetical protein ARMGADRAFT_1011925 [Armillaria gallica]